MHLLLCPQLDQFPLVHLALETIVILDVAIPVLKLVQRRLEYLDCTLGRNHLIFNPEEKEISKQ